MRAGSFDFHSKMKDDLYALEIHCTLDLMRLTFVSFRLFGVYSV